ncbi:MAG TPA: BatD family protein [Candidatus Krumholzibacteria bacterium]|nr:BatD family protein [Candidatus Krumholzibacteria bacterium]
MIGRRIAPDRRRLWLGFLLGALFLCGNSLRASAAVSCSAAVDRSKLAVGEQVVLTLNIEGEVRKIEDPQLPDFGPFEVYGGGTSQSFSFVNGKVHASHTYTWYLRPLEPGKYQLAPIAVVADGNTYHTKQIPLEVVPAGSPNAPTQNRNPSTSSTAPKSKGSRSTRSGGPGDDYFVSMTVDKDTVVVGEQVVLTFTFYRGMRGGVFDSPQYTPPTTEGFWREDLPPERHSTMNVQGYPYDITQILYALFPTRSGELTIGEAVVRIPQDPFGSFFRRQAPRGDITLRAPSIPVYVKELPPGAPAGFAGTVGSDLQLSMKTDRTSLKVGDALTVSLLLSGSGYLAAANKPELPQMSNFRQHDSGSSLDSGPSGGVLRGSLKVDKLLIPQKEGNYTIPPVDYVYFDTEKRRYLHLKTKPVTIEVSPSDEAPISSFATGGKTEIAILGQDILHIQAVSGNLKPYPGPLVLRRSTWVLGALAPLLWLASIALATRRRRLLADPLGHRASQARKLASSRLSAEGSDAQRASEALMIWFGAKARRPVSGLTRAELLEWLESRGADEDLKKRVTNLLDHCDEARFAAAAEGSGLSDEARSLLLDLEKELGRG